MAIRWHYYFGLVRSESPTIRPNCQTEHATLMKFRRRESLVRNKGGEKGQKKGRKRGVW